uniref:Uncharacterized protein n=1 Tax=Rhizophora mucronata TaxID=61149 RepID=A0A2P2JTG9_RHIMU
MHFPTSGLQSPILHQAQRRLPSPWSTCRFDGASSGSAIHSTDRYLMTGRADPRRR